MSQLVRLEGKHTAQSTHCALFKQCYAHIAAVLTKTIQRHFDIDTDISWQFQHFKSWKWWKWHDIIHNSCAFCSTDPWNLFMSWSSHSTPVVDASQRKLEVLKVRILQLPRWREWLDTYLCNFSLLRVHLCTTDCISGCITFQSNYCNPFPGTRQKSTMDYLVVDILWV